MWNIDYTKAKNETDFLLLCSRDFKITKYRSKPYLRVYRIGKTTIHPDIDILYIDPNRHNPYNPLRKGFIEAFEVKTLYEGSYKEFYQGLGQALMYYKFGIDKVTLILGDFKIKDKKKSEGRFCAYRQDCLYLQNHVLRNIFVYIKLFRPLIQKIEQVFPLNSEGSKWAPNLRAVTDDEVETKRNKLINGDFATKEWCKNYFKERGKVLGIE